jgi:hypothetical protein
MPHTETHGVVYPDELGALKAVFEDACRKAKITRGSPEAERLALKVMLLFQGGVDDWGRLLEAAIKLPDADERQEDHLRCG